ncbi:MAG: CapA family protein [Treponema sp.]|jgi:poly-gamma-glutamate synthesis protein (capsule biosynthesis protein)|nr:CapA family protein [Treponema sp.]
MRKLTGPGGAGCLLFCALLCVSCGIKPAPDGILFKGGEALVPEREFLEQLLAGPDFLKETGLYVMSQNKADRKEDKTSGGNTTVPAVVAEFEAAWKELDGLLISKTWFVPKEDPLSGRIQTSLAACLNGTEDLIPLAELAPPYTGLLVDGLAADDTAYSLIRRVSVRIRMVDENENPQIARKRTRRKIQERIAALETKLNNTPMPLIQGAPVMVWITAAGDLMLGRGSGDILLREGPQGILGKTAGYFARADIGMVNLEGTVSSRGNKIEKAYNFRFDTRTVPILRDSGINAVLLANNHVFDFGLTAFLDTLDHLEQNGIAALGAGRNIEAAASPFVFKKDAMAVRVFGFASYPRERSGWDGASAAAGADRPGLLFAADGGTGRLKTALSEDTAALNVLMFHGGNEWSWEPDMAARRLYTELAHSGADVLIGSHPHTTQGFEWLEGKPMFWSLGNYVFAGMDNTSGGEEGLLVRLGFAEKKLIYLEPVPVRLNGPRSNSGSPEQLRRFYELSKKLAHGKHEGTFKN